MLKRLLIFFIIIGIVAGGILFYAWWRDRDKDTLTKDWPWYRNPQFKYRLRYPPGWLVEPGWMVEEEGRQIYLVSVEEKQAEEENLAVCEGLKEGICEPEMPSAGIFVEVIDKPKDQDLESWFEQEYQDSDVYSKEEFLVRIIPGIKAETNGLFSVYNIFLAQPSYVMKLSQFFEETPELSLVAKTVQLPEEREIAGTWLYVVVGIIGFLLIFFYLPRWIMGKKKK